MNRHINIKGDDNMKKAGIYLFTTIMILSISFVGLTGETTVNELLERVENIEERLADIESKFESDDFSPQEKETHNIQGKFELSKFNFREYFMTVEAVGEIKALEDSYTSVRFNLVVYDKSGAILDNVKIVMRDISKGERRTFTQPIYALESAENIASFRLKIDRTR